MRIDKSNGIPKYIQLKEILKSKILSSYKPGDRFMTEHQIMDNYKVSCATVGHSMKYLMKEGLVVRKRGAGTFVESMGPPSASDLKLPEELILNGRGMHNDKSFNPLGWFIRSEIQRGIINTYNGSVKILNFYELKAAIESGSAKCMILQDPDPEIIEMEMPVNVKYIVIDHNHYCHHRVCNTVFWEQLPGVYEAMKYLIDDLGHKRIGHIRGTSRYHADRFAGYQIGLRTFDIPYDEELVMVAEAGSETDGYKAMRKLLALKKKPTAVFVDTDIKALGAIQAVRDFSLRVPDDISILGYDDNPETEDFDPPLTTVRVPNYDMGRKAAKMLKQILETGEDISNETLATKLIIRDTCAEVKKTA